MQRPTEQLFTSKHFSKAKTINMKTIHTIQSGQTDFFSENGKVFHIENNQNFFSRRVIVPQQI